MFAMPDVGSVAWDVGRLKVESDLSLPSSMQVASSWRHSGQPSHSLPAMPSHQQASFSLCQGCLPPSVPSLAICKRHTYDASGIRTVVLPGTM